MQSVLLMSVRSVKGMVFLYFKKMLANERGRAISCSLKFAFLSKNRNDEVIKVFCQIVFWNIENGCHVFECRVRIII